MGTRLHRRVPESSLNLARGAALRWSGSDGGATRCTVTWCRRPPGRPPGYNLVPVLCPLEIRSFFQAEIYIKCVDFSCLPEFLEKVWRIGLAVGRWVGLYFFSSYCMMTGLFSSSRIENLSRNG